MQTQHVAAGATIFRTGEPSLAVYVIEDGEVAITVGNATAQIEVARLRAGELFGESGVLEARPRAATATAVTAATLLVTEAETFIRAFGPSTTTARCPWSSCCAAACARPRCAVPNLTWPRGRPLAPPRPGSRTSPSALFRATSGWLPSMAWRRSTVRRLPFQAGNRFGGETLPITSDRNCCIPALGATDLAAPHFEILRRDGRPGIRDLGSRHGTIVNGVGVGGPVACLGGGLRSAACGRQ